MKKVRKEPLLDAEGTPKKAEKAVDEALYKAKRLWGKPFSDFT